MNFIMFEKYLVSLMLAVHLFCCLSQAATLKNGLKSLKWTDIQRTNLLDLEPAGLEGKYPDLRVYVARVLHQSNDRGLGLIPGKYIDKWGMCYYSFHGYFYETSSCEVLVYPRSSMSWIPVENIDSLDNVIIGGLDPLTSEILRICRLELQDDSDGATLMPGKLYPSGECVGYWGGHDVAKRSNYEVLVVNAYGQFINEQHIVNMAKKINE